MNPIDQAFTYKNFRLIIEHAPIGVVIVDKDYKWILTNKRFSEIIGYSRDELQDKTFLDITYKDDVQNNINLYQQMTSGQMERYDYEKRYVKKNGEIIWARLTVAGVRISGEYSYMLALVQDIDDIKRYQSNLEYKNKELDTLFYKVSHDLKAPVASLEGLCQLLKQEVELADNKSFDHLEKTVLKLKTQNELLLQLASINEIKYRAFEMPFTSTVTKALDGRQDEIDVQISALPDAINADPVLLSIIFKHLFDNAILFSEEKERPKVEISLEIHANTYLIKFRDFGSGINPALFDKVFNMFFIGSMKSKGSGLGLYITKKSIEKMNSEIAINTPDGPGTLFIIRIPVQEQ